MNRDDVLRLAEANGIATISEEMMERFFRAAYAAGAAAEREAITAEGWRRCAVGQRTTQFCGMLEDAVKAEREECAKVCDERIDAEYAGPDWYKHAQECAAAIRARGEK